MKNKIDHKNIGKKYDLFSFHECGVGHVFVHDRGLKIKNQLIKWWCEIHDDDYLEIESPQLLDISLWEKSGHWKNFKEHMYVVNAPDREYALKPMSCPGAILFYQQKRRFHSELPMRLAELGKVHRYDNSGSLNGLLRVRSFVQDDAHIFCQKEQAYSEIKQIVLMAKQLLGRCGSVHLSSLILIFPKDLM